MYASPVVAPVATTNNRKNAWPLAAICCLGLLGFLIATTIVLALIPVYLPAKQATLNNQVLDNDTFFLEYETDGNENSSFTGTAEDLPELQRQMTSALGVDDLFDVDSANLQTTFVRRRRSLLLTRTRRTIKNKCLLRCKPKFPRTCSSNSCRTRIRTRIRSACERVRTIPNLSIRLRNRQFGLRTVSFSLTFVSFTALRPAGFLGEPSNYSVFVAVRSGEFNNPATWSDGIVPYGRISIVISAGVTVTISNPAMTLAIAKWDIFGSLAVGSSANANFVFAHPTNLVVRSGGSLQDRTSGKSIFCRTGTQLTFFPGGSFTGSNTIIRTFTALPAASNAGANFTLGSSISGPFTCGIISNTQVLSFNRVTYITAASGNFGTSDTWLAGNIPSADTCSAVNGCGLFISPGHALLTASLNGQLNINFNSITVNSGSSLQLSSGTSTGGFTFPFAVNIIVRSGGSLQDQTTTKRIYCLPASVLTFFPGASFSGSNTMVYRFTSLPATGSLGASFTLGSSLSGPFTCAVLVSGEIQTFNSVTYIAAVSGSFTAGGTWLGGIAPTADTCSAAGGCGVFISSGCTLSTASFNGQLSINLISITVSNGAIFQLSSGSSSGGFTFVFPVSIIVRSGGSLQDQTTTKRIYCLPASVFTFFAGASFSGSNTMIYRFTSLPATGSLGASFTLGSSISGALTCAVLVSGEIQTFNSVTYIAAVSGSFTAGGTWLGGIAPTADTCSAAGGCGVFISSGCTLSTASFNGQLTINLISITVSNGAIFQLSSGSSSGGFTFVFPVSIIVRSGGSLQDQTTTNRIYCLPASVFTFFAGASFSGSNTMIYRFTSLPATGSLGASFTLGSSISGALTCAILVSGEIQTFNSVTFIAAVSGSFTAGGTWLGGIAPTADTCSGAGGCGVFISSGCTLSTASFNGQLSINLISITISNGAIFQLSSGSSSGGFTFVFPVSVIVRSGGSLQDQTTTNRIYCLPASVFTFFAGASFSGSNTMIYRFTSLPATGSLGASFTLGSSISGALTCAVLVSGEIQTFNSVTLIAAVSGSFTAGGTWLGGIAPTVDFCNLAGGCGVYISSGCILSTASLNGELRLNILKITVATGGTFSLGTAGLSTGFRFFSVFQFDILGTLSVAASGGSIFLPFGCGFNFFLGATFRSSYSVQIRTFDLAVGGDGVLIISLDSSFTGPIFVSISITGQIQESSGPATILPITTTAATTLGSITTSSVSLNFTAAQSGAFNDSATWVGGIVPFGQCTVTIPSGIIVTFFGELLNIEIKTLTLSGTFIISSPTACTFQYAINIIVQGSGTLEDRTSEHRLYFLSGSICTFFASARFIGSNTIVYKYTSLPATGSLGANYTFGPSFTGPFTFGILISGEIQTFNSVTCIAGVSGSFTVGSTWLGGIAPTVDFCNLVGGCGLYIPSGCILLTDSLNGELRLNILKITVATGGTFSLGSTSLSTGFRFYSSFQFDIFGTLSIAASSGSIFLPFGCAFNFFSGAIFQSTFRLDIRIVTVQVL